MPDLYATNSSVPTSPVRQPQAALAAIQRRLGGSRYEAKRQTNAARFWKANHDEQVRRKRVAQAEVERLRNVLRIVVEYEAEKGRAGYVYGLCSTALNIGYAGAHDDTRTEAGQAGGDVA